MIATAAVAVGIHFAGRWTVGIRDTRKDLLQLWNAGSFGEAFNRSQTALDSRPMDYFFLTMHGFSAYQLGVSQINSMDASQYFDEGIHALRKAMLLKDSAEDGRLYYVLGKAYSYKGESYADLAVEYLEKARALSFRTADIPQFLGMAYAGIGDYQSSVVAFAEALGSSEELGPSGLLLLSIARSYVALGDYEMAQAYLQRCIEVSLDYRSILSARLLLAEVLRETGNFDGAMEQFKTILAETNGNAEAHYQLGELYTMQGERARARAEWRLALKVDPTHSGARTRLSL
jgi:tetratricopeptide (TPR) repeat protein